MEFYNDPEKVDKYEDMCKEYDGTELYELLRTSLKKNSTLLEIGCGPGNDIEHLRSDYKVTGSDLSDEFLSRCSNKFPDLSFLKLDAVSLNTKDKFDCLFSNKVLHHLKTVDLKKSFKRQQEVIKKEGLFAHTFWIGDKEFEMEGMYFKFHDKEELLRMISEYFTIITTHTYTEMEDNDSIFVIARNN